MSLELAWGRVRRCWLRTFRPGYVRRMHERRQGDCPNCPHQIIDPRDLKYFRNVCGYWFKPEDDRFRWRGRLGLARVGLVEILLVSWIALLILAGVALGSVFGMPLWLAVPAAAVVVVFWSQLVWFFRDPERRIPDEADALVSPADGRVTDIGVVEEPDFPGGRALRIGIFLSVFDVHVNRAARAGRITRVQYFPGRFWDARRPQCPVENEQLWIDLEDGGTGQPMRIKQIAGAIARRIVCWLKPGDAVACGERIGMIKYGSRTEVLLPAELACTVAVAVGEPVRGGATVLLRLKPERPASAG
jgi:phosphatidylserine decarboxylase